jgi:hypothetical protein
MLDVETARIAQSVGIIVDYLAAQGLIDKEDFKIHINQRFHSVDSNESEEGFTVMIDVYS